MVLLRRDNCETNNGRDKDETDCTRPHHEKTKWRTRGNGRCCRFFDGAMGRALWDRFYWNW